MLECGSENDASTGLTLAPLVCQQRRWFRVSRLDPRRKQSSLVRLVPQVLVQVRVGDLLQRLHVVHWHQVTVQVHELYADLHGPTSSS